MRNRMRTQEIAAPRGAYDGGSEAWRGKCWGYPHPGCFAKRGCKLLILNGDDRKKSGKRLQFTECKELSLAGRMRREVVSRANMTEIIISVYRSSSDFWANLVSP